MSEKSSMKFSKKEGEAWHDHNFEMGVAGEEGGEIFQGGAVFT